MNTFPTELKINKNQDVCNDKETVNKFELLNYERLIKELRQELYNLIISRKDENEYFDIELFGRSHNYKNKNLEKMISSIRLELENMGWNTKLSFGDTGLFIFSTNENPSSCW
jgi:(p)ppGpp synthase/HD superfamily hydrolase